MKQIKSLFLKMYIRLNTRRKKINGINIGYLLQKEKSSDRLIVVFSGWPSVKIRGGAYNYVRTLKEIRANKLFILDNEGFEGLGTYYLGNSCRWLQNNVIDEFIRKIIEKCQAKEVIFVGSSKGATCALLYGLRMNADKVICGSPQYRIARYMQHSGEHQKKTLPMVLENSNYSEEDIDALVADAVKLPDRKTKIHLMYSSEERAYPVDLHLLVDQLRESKLACYLYDMVDQGYTDHSQVAKYYKPFLLKKLHEE